jgi:thymidylate synthase (FAD)
MQIITEPHVDVISSQNFIPQPEFPLPPDGDERTMIGAFAAKSCYASFGVEGKPNEANQLRVIQERHGSVLEHIVIGLYVTGVTRALTLELNRHRHLAISQRSTRYTDESEAVLVLEPEIADLYLKHWRINNPAKDAYGLTTQEAADKDPRYAIIPNGMAMSTELLLLRNHLYSAEHAFDAYIDEVKLWIELNPRALSGVRLRKWARGKARNLLPHGLETRAVYTGNVRAWRHILEARSGIGAEEEIRRLTYLLYMRLKDVAPLYFSDYEQIAVPGSKFPVLVTPYSKV